MKIEWLNTSLTRALITRRAWPRFWTKESALVCFCLFGGYSYWFYEDFKDSGLSGMVDGHSDNGSCPEHSKYGVPYFSLAKKLFNAQEDQELLRRRNRKTEACLALDAAREGKNPWKGRSNLPIALLRRTREHP